MDTQHRIAKALDNFRMEIPSWGFANTGTRFGKFLQPEAATSLEEKFADAAQVHSLTGSCPTLALHVEWDLPNGRCDVTRIRRRRSPASPARSPFFKGLRLLSISLTPANH